MQRKQRVLTVYLAILGGVHLFFLVPANLLSGSFIWALVFALLGILMLASVWVIALVMTLLNRSNPSFSSDVQFDVSPEGIRVLTRFSRARIKWAGFWAWAEDEDTVLLFPHSGSAVIIPKRLIPVTDRSGFMELVKTGVSKRV